MADERTPLVEMRNISVSFGGIHAVDDCTIDLYPGEVVGLVGGNGAGKSTLMKVLSGAYHADSGRSSSTASRSPINNPRDAKALGIETIYQTLALADNVDAPANLFLGREIMTRWNTLDDVAMEAAARKVMGRLNPQLQALQDAGEGALRRPAPVGGHRPRDPFQRPHPDHGRADRGARAGRDGAGPRPDQAAEEGRHRHLPDQPRDPRRLRSRRPHHRHEERRAWSARSARTTSPPTRSSA